MEDYVRLSQTQTANATLPAAIAKQIENDRPSSQQTSRCNVRLLISIPFAFFRKMKAN